LALTQVSALAEGSADRFRDSDIGFSYQAIAGVSYRIGERTDLAIEYRYSGTSRASFTDNPGGTGSVTSHLDRNSQSVLLKMNFAF
jgi:opacity protein-like surface antigen